MQGFVLGLVSAAVAGAAVMVAAPAAQARPLTPAEQRFLPWHAQLPACNDPSVLGTVQSRFSQRESYYWKSGLEIVGFDKIRETGFRSDGVDYIPRRYCSATAWINDQKARTITYSVIEDMGMTGGDAITGFFAAFGVNAGSSYNWGVDWCVSGLDRNYAYGRNCQAARP